MHLVSCSNVFFAPCLLYSEFGELSLAQKISFPGFSMTEGSKVDSPDNKDTEEEEEKQVEEATVSDMNQGKTPTIGEKKVEQVEHEVIASEPKYRKTPTREEIKLEKVKHEVAIGDGEAKKTTHIKETNSDPESNILATDEERIDGSTSTARITNQGRESCFIDPSFMMRESILGVFIILKLDMTNLFASR